MTYNLVNQITSLQYTVFICKQKIGILVNEKKWIMCQFNQVSQDYLNSVLE